MDLGLDVADQTNQVGDDVVLVAGNRAVHGLNLDLGVRLYLRCDVVLAAHILRLVVLERLLPLCLVPLNFSLGLVWKMLSLL